MNLKPEPTNWRQMQPANPTPQRETGNSLNKCGIQNEMNDWIDYRKSINQSLNYWNSSIWFEFPGFIAEVGGLLGVKLGLSCLLVVVCWMNPEFIAPKHPSGFNQPTSNKPNFLPQVLVCVVIGNSSILTGSSNLSVPAIMHRDASYSSFTVLVRYWLILYVLAYCYNKLKLNNESISNKLNQTNKCSNQFN